MIRPPRWLAALLRTVLGEERAEEVIGDRIELAEARGHHGWRLRDSWDAVRLCIHWTREEGMAPETKGSGNRGRIWRDLRLAGRTIRRSPGVAVPILVTLALAVGVTSALFSVVDAVVFRALPFDDPESMVLLQEVEPPDGRLTALAPPTLEDYRAGMTTLDALGGWAPERFTLTGLGDPVQITAVRVTEELFPVLRATPSLGRLLDPANEAERTTAVLSHGFWLERFGGEPDALGRHVILDDTPYEIVGVMPPGFRFPDDDAVALWVPHVWYPWERQRWTRTTQAIGRLSAGASLTSATAEAETLAAGLAEAHPRTNEGWSATVRSAGALRGDRSDLAILAGMVVMVLLIAVTNVTNLLGIRAGERERELAVRAALGAGRGAIARILLVESALFGLLGALAGLGVAWIALRAVLALEPGVLPGWHSIGLDLRVIAFTGAVGLAAAVVAGAAPALRARRNVTPGSGGLRTTVQRSTLRARAVLSAAEVALAIMLTTGAALLVTSLVRLQDVDPGFEADGLLAATVELPESRYDYGDGRMAQAYDGILSHVRAQPGIRSAGWVTALPMSPVGTDYDIDFFRSDRMDITPEDGPPRADFRVVSEGYLETLGLPLLHGRTLRDDLATGAPGTVVVNELFAERYFPGEDPLGKPIRLYQVDGEQYEVVGVVGNVRHRGLDDQNRPEIYVEFHRMTHDAMTLVVRTAGDPAAYADAVVESVRAVDADLPVLDLRPMTDLVGDTLAARRFNTALLLSFAFLGLALALVGVQGTLSYAVSRRTREIGVRMAVGAEPTRVLLDVLRGGARMVLAGLLLGIMGAWATSRLLRSLLYGVAPDDPRILGAVALLVGTVALLATVLPATRAARIDPVRALNDEG